MPIILGILLMVSSLFAADLESDLPARAVEALDSKGVARVRIDSPLPDPQMQGKVYKRDIGVSGIQLNDNEGNEVGGFGNIDGTRVSVVALDYTQHEAVMMYASDTEENPSAGISVNQRVMAEDIFNRPNYRRIELKVEGDIPSLVFKGKDGKPRMIIGLDGDDNPVIEIIDKEGNKKSLIEP